MSFSPFVQNLLTACQRSPRNVVLAEGDEPRTLEAAALLFSWGAVKNLTLLGDSTKIHQNLPKALECRLGQELTTLDPSDITLRDRTSLHILSMLKSKGKTPELNAVSGIASQPLYQAGALLASGQVDCAVAGAVATTSDVIRAALTTVGLKAGIKTVSGGFFMDRSGGSEPLTYFYADAGVVIDPTVEQLIDIASSSCETWQNIMNTPPVVAFLSFSTRGSAKHQNAEKMAMACEGFKSRQPDIEADGEFQFDAAVDPAVGKRKAPDSSVVGRANLFIFPDLNSGNIGYKITQRLAGFRAYGPILQGLAKPYSDLSRGADPVDIAISVLINSLRICT